MEQREVDSSKEILEFKKERTEMIERIENLKNEKDDIFKKNFVIDKEIIKYEYEVKNLKEIVSKLTAQNESLNRE